MKKSTVLVTGGAGYIGSMTCVELLLEGYGVVIVDDLSNSSSIAIDRIEEITKIRPDFYQMKVQSEELAQVFERHSIDAVIHFAGYKAVGESVREPLKYYANNLESTLHLCEVMKAYQVKKIVFSSSATVYGEDSPMPCTEEFGRGICTNPYGWTKWMQEQILTDQSAADREWKVSLLRYFNPIGAHPSGLLGEDPKGIPNNLLPYVAKVAVGKLPQLGVFGNDYDTKDGTGVRDYIHVMDLARGHVLALQHMEQQEGVLVVNLGTGRGYSVLEVVQAFEKACGKMIPLQILPRRDGDLATCFCDPQKAKETIGFSARYTLEDMCRDTWNWQKNNPNGYEAVD